MTAQADEIKAFLSRMSVLYGPPETPDPRAFIREYEAVLSNYATNLVAMAGNYIRDTHMRRSWPTPAEVREALRAVAPLPEPIDWDAVEADRKKGWKFDDLGKAAIDDAAKARVNAMVEEMKRNLAANKITDKADPTEHNWQRGQRDGFREMQRNSPNKALHMTPYGLSRLSKRMTGEDE